MTEHKPEFSRPLSVDSLGGGPVTRRIEADATERDALARRFGLEALNRFEATVTATREAGGEIVSVSGTLAAEPVQVCVVTLEPFPNPVEDSFEIKFTTVPPAAASVVDIEIDPDSLDEPEPLEGRTLDLGELASQFLSLALDPHPRRPGAEIDPDLADPGAGGADNPFAALRALKPRA